MRYQTQRACILIEPTRSRWPRKPHLRQTQFLPLGLCLCSHRGHRLDGSSFGAGRARDAGLLRCVGEVIDVTAVFPLRHAAIVMTAAVPVAHAVRVADEERPDPVLDTKVDDPARGLMPQIAHSPLGPSTDLVLGSLELLEASGVLLAAAQLLGELPELLAALPLEAADAAPGDDEGLARSRW